MDVFIHIGRLLFGGLILYLGAEWLVKGSSGLARAFGVKEFVVGLTVVAYGTSAPELAVSTAAALDGSNPIVLGNVIGSCVANLALVLGFSVLLTPPQVDGSVIRLYIPVLFVSVAAVPLVLLNGHIGRIEGAVLVTLALTFTLLSLLSPARENAPSIELAEQSAEAGGAPGGEGKLRLSIITAIGLGLLVGGSELFVDGARGVALKLHVSERIVGLTIVAIGTSLPELVTAIVAGMKGKEEMVLGTLIGSNVFNVFLILGVVSTLRPVSGSLGGISVDLGFLVATTLLAALFMRSARRISRIEGAILLVVYAAFVVFLAGGW